MRFLGILLLFLMVSCKQDDCPLSTNTSYSIKPELKNYFPYASGKKIIFAKYIDTNYLGDQLFLVDTSWLYVKVESYSHDCNAGMGQYYENTHSECLEISLLNQIQNNRHAKITFIGKYKEGKYINNADPSELQIQFAGKNFESYYFGDVAENPENSPLRVNNIEVLGKSYGPGFCIKSAIDPFFTKDTMRIYFNSTHGILKYENEETKEKYFYKE